MKILIIGNPIAGGGKARGLIDALQSLFLERGYETEVFLTSAAGDGLKRAENISSDLDVLVVCGGDGTLNEVINGLRAPGAFRIAFLPAGTGNVIAHELKLTRTPVGVLEAIEKGTVRSIDLGIASGRKFLMLASAGFDAEVTKEIQRSRKGKLGYRRYLFPILRTFFKYRSSIIDVSVDGADSVKCALVIVTKTPYYGGVLSITDDASCDSGYFTVCVFPSVSLFALLSYAVAGYMKRMDQLSGVTYLKGKHIEISADRPTPVEIDGDYFGVTPLIIDLMPGAVSILV